MRQKIKNYDNYEIDTDGNVYNLNTCQQLKGSIGEHGYKYFRLSLNGSKKMYYAHRLVAETFLKNPNHYPVVNHIDGNKLNNNINNLEWVSYSENTSQWHQLSTTIRKPIEYYTVDYANEIWKSFGSYDISSYGRIKRHNRNNLLKPTVTCGYYKVRLSENGLVQDYLVHQLVYKIFFTDYDNTKIIDHIDGNKLNNNINNLRQVSNSENVLCALYLTKTNSSAKPVDQYDLNGNFINSFLSARDAARHLQLDSSTISKVCRGQNKTHGGFIFKYSK